MARGNSLVGPQGRTQDAHVGGRPSSSDGEAPATEDTHKGLAGRAEQRLAMIRARVPAPVSARLAWFSRWKLALLAGIVLLMLLWSGAVATSTSFYSATVLVTETTHGLAPPGNPFDFGDLPPTASMDNKLTFKNDGKLNTYMMIMVFGDIRDFLDIEDAFFNLKPGQEREILVKLTLPSTAEPGKRYNGRVVVTRLPWWAPW